MRTDQNTNFRILKCKQTTSTSFITLTLRDKVFRTLSPEPLASKEAPTTRKCKFFDALARRAGTKAEYFESKEHEITWRILKRGRCSRVSGFVLLLRLVSKGTHLNYGSIIISKILLSVLLYLRSLVGARKPRQTKNTLNV